MIKSILFACSALLIPCFNLSAQPGALDTNFGNNGVAFPSQNLFWGRMESYNALAVQPDGRFLLTGMAQGNAPNYNDIALLRCAPNGELDPTFGTNGLVLTDIDNQFQTGKGIALQSDGKIVVVATSDSDVPSYLLRYHGDGTPDLSFGDNGRVSISLVGYPVFTYNDIYSVAVQADQKIVVAGSVNNGTDGLFFLFRFHADGTPDLGFGENGMATTDIENGEDVCRDMDIQADGKIVLAGYSDALNGFNPKFTILRYTTDGKLDPAFNNGQGYVIMDVPGGYLDCWCYSLKIQHDGKIVAVGAGIFSVFPSLIDNIIIRYNSDGSLDESFGDNGIVVFYFDNVPECWSTNLDIQADGKLIVSGYCRNGFDQDMVVYRYNSDGSLDPGFGPGGFTAVDLGSYSDYTLSCAIAGDKLLVTGNRSEEYYAVVCFQLEQSSGTRPDLPTSFEPIRAFPNPLFFDGRVTLEFNPPRESDVTIDLYDAQGRLVAALWRGRAAAGEQTRTLDLPAGCPKGSYFLTVAGVDWKMSVQLKI